jgi:dolichyl-phosphate beta-glucosyltransferase
LSVVIPALNESVRLPPTLRAIADYVDGHPAWLPAEVVIVDDGSNDGTDAAARDVEIPPSVELVLLSHPTNRGKGAAVRTGFAAARGDWLLLSDADLATPIEDIDVVRRAAGRARVAFGSRAVDRRLIEVHQPRYRDLMGRTFNLAVRTLLLPGVYDTQCGFKLFPGDLGRALAAVQTIDGFAYDVELLVLARRWGYELSEVPVRWRHVEASQVRAVHHSGEMLFDLLQLWLRRIFNRLPRRPSNITDPSSETG